MHEPKLDIKKLAATVFSQYLDELDKVPAPAQLVQSDQLSIPIPKLFTQSPGFSYFNFCSLATDTLMNLAESTNDLIDLSTSLAAWKNVLDDLSEMERVSIFGNFVWKECALAACLPYAIKQRYFFHVAHVSLHANILRDPLKWSDNASNLPKNKDIKQEQTQILAKGWKSWRKLCASIEQIDDHAYKVATLDYRDKYTHRYPPSIEYGVPISGTCTPADDSALYLFHSENDLTLAELVSALDMQCKAASKAYPRLIDLLKEQRDAIVQ